MNLKACVDEAEDEEDENISRLAVACTLPPSPIIRSVVHPIGTVIGIIVVAQVS